MIDFGIAFADYQNVRSDCVRRHASAWVNDITNWPSCKIDGTSVSPPPNPTTKADATNTLICKAKDRIGLDSGDAKIRITITGEAVGDRLKICASFPVGSMTGVTRPSSRTES